MLDTFKWFLSAKESLPEKNPRHYVKGAADCYRYFDIPESRTLTNDQNSKFLNHLAKNHEDWQVQQADRALKLRHRSYRTEKTYIIWLRQFRGFVDGGHPEVLKWWDIS